MSGFISTYVHLPTWDDLVVRDVLAFVNECRRSLALPETTYLCKGRRMADGSKNRHASVIGRSIVENDERPLESVIDVEAETVTVRNLRHCYAGQPTEHVFRIPANIVTLFLRPFERNEFGDLRQDWNEGHSYSRRYNISAGGVSMYAQYADEVREILRTRDVNWINEGYADYRDHSDSTEIIRRTGAEVNPTRFVGSLRAAA
jgi:hypothetical protein